MERSPPSPVGPHWRKVLRILSVRSKLDGVGHYRVSIPALALRDRGHTVDILDNKPTIRICNQWFADYDAVILQNLADTGWIEVIKTIPEGRRPVTIGCIDDLIGGLDRSNPCFREYELARPKVIECMGLCDGMIYSTPEIASHYAGLNRRYQVVPNYLDIPGLRDWDTQEERLFPDRFVVGWLGGTQHVNDELPMREGLKAFLDANPRALFAFCGNGQLSVLWKKSIGVSDDQWRYIKPPGIGEPEGNFDRYQTVISQFDVGVAPLQNTEFNRCKSDLRLLEYGAWGVPYVASNIAPYRRFAGEVFGGYLAATPEEWIGGLLALRDDREREKIGGWLKQHVREHRGSYACGEAWEKALSAIISGEALQSCDTVTKVSRNERCPCGSGAKYKRCCFPAWGE